MRISEDAELIEIFSREVGADSGIMGVSDVQVVKNIIGVLEADLAGFEDLSKDGLEFIVEGLEFSFHGEEFS